MRRAPEPRPAGAAPQPAAPAALDAPAAGASAASLGPVPVAPAAKARRATLRAAAAVALAGYVVAMGVIALLQDRLLLYPPTAAGTGESLSAVGAPLFDAQGERLGWVREPEMQPARATIVVFHGNAGCAHHHGPLADRLAERGWRVVSAEYPGYCGRPGKASVDAILDDAAQQLDAARALQADAPLVAGGYSLGAAVAAAAARRREVGGLLLVTPWASFAALAQHHYPFLPARLLARRDLETIEALAQAPRRREAVVLVGAARDTIIPVQQARQLAERHPAALYLELPEAGHNDWIDRMRAADWDAIVARLTR